MKHLLYYNTTSEFTSEQIAENEKNTVTNEKLVDYMKAANDLYEELVNTN